MKRCLIYLAVTLLAAPVFAEKLPSPIKLEVTKEHMYDFSKKALVNSESYFSDIYSKGNSYSFDGENLIFCTKDGYTTINPVSKFVRTEAKDEKAWQYIITLDSKERFPTVVEIKFLLNNDANVLFPLIDEESGDLWGLLVSECKVMP